MAQSRQEICKRYRLTHKIYCREYNRKWQQLNKEKMAMKSRKYQLKRSYGITPEDYNAMFFKQEGKCAICSKHQNQLSKKLAVDHDHKTGIVRGLLCGYCNGRVVGLIENHRHLIGRALIYLKLQ